MNKSWGILTLKSKLQTKNFRALKLSSLKSFKALKLSIQVLINCCLKNNQSILAEGLGCLFIINWFRGAAWIILQNLILEIVKYNYEVTI